MSKNHFFFFLKRKESRGGSNRSPAYQPSDLPLGHTGSPNTQVTRFCSDSGRACSSVTERRTRARKVAGSISGRNGRRIFFSTDNFLCSLSLRYPFCPRVTAVARKRAYYSAKNAERNSCGRADLHFKKWQSHKTVFINPQFLKRRERRAEADRTKVLLLTSQKRSGIYRPNTYSLLPNVVLTS